MITGAEPDDSAGYPQLSLAIVGVDYPNKRGPARRFELEICQPGEPIELRPEPDNPADEHAVAVFSCRGIQLGYLRSERAVRIGQLIRRGVDVIAIFQEQTQWGGIVRAAFDGEHPMLVNRPKRPETPDFWPDYIPPDD